MGYIMEYMFLLHEFSGTYVVDSQLGKPFVTVMKSTS